MTKHCQDCGRTDGTLIACIKGTHICPKCYKARRESK